MTDLGKFGPDVLHVISSNNWDFSENQRSKSRSLLKGLNGTLKYFLLLCPILINSVQKLPTNIYRVLIVFVKIGAGKFMLPLCLMPINKIILMRLLKTL